MNRKDADINDIILEAIENLSLSEEEKTLLGADTTILPRLWVDTSDTILLRYFKAIMQAQVDKAMRGDTASAKFLTEFIEPANANSTTITDPVQWEQLAIELRNRLSLEVSAEELVVKLLTALVALPNSYTIDLLSST